MSAANGDVLSAARLVALRALLLAAALAAGLADRAARAEEPVRFAAVDVVVDAGAAPLAAYQVEIDYDRAACALVGVEGGDAPFAREPYYDPRGLTAGKIVVADFVKEGALGHGRVRVARVHLALRGDPKLAARVTAAATGGGKKIAAQVVLAPLERSGGR